MPAKVPQISLQELLQDAEERRLVLPNFQRDFIWERKEQQRLLSSFLVNLPIGNILKVEGEPDDFASRQLCFPREVIPADHCTYLLDGQQRISTLKTILDDVFRRDDHKELWDKIYNKLRWRWFIKLKPSENEDIDPFGWKDLTFKNPNRYEPGDIYDFIEAKRIWKNKTGEWYQPNFTPTNDNGKELSKSDRRIHIAEECANRGLIPLWEVYKYHDKNRNKKRKSLHHRSIKYIADRRVERIRGRAENTDNNEVTPQDIFEDINKKALEKYNKGKLGSDIINEAWDDLKSDWKSDIKNYLDSVVKNEIVQIELPDDEIHRAIALFEHINTSGTDLDTYDLIVAKAARDKDIKNLSRRILSILKKSFPISPALLSGVRGDAPSSVLPSNLGTVSSKIGNAPSKYFKEQFLNLLSIYCHCGFSIDEIRVRHTKRREQLELSYEDINVNTKNVVKAILRSIVFLYFRCGIRDIGNQEYTLMTLPISFSFLKDEFWESEEAINKIESWYWTSLFGGYYRENQNETCIEDLKGLYRWLNGNSNPFQSRRDSVLEAEDYSDVVTLLGQNEEYDVKKAISNGVVQYILSRQPFDLKEEEERLYSWKDKIEPGYQIEEHHVIPLALSDSEEDAQEIRDNPNHILNSPLNLTPVSAEANNSLATFSPEETLSALSSLHTARHSLPPPKQFEDIGFDSDRQDIEDVLIDRYSKMKQDISSEVLDLASS